MGAGRARPVSYTSVRRSGGKASLRTRTTSSAATPGTGPAGGNRRSRTLRAASGVLAR